MPCSSAAASVMILNVLPGGCGAETARPASASTEPSRGRITATPPTLPPSADCAVFCSPSRIVVCTDFAPIRGCGGVPRPEPDRGVAGLAADRRTLGDRAFAEAQDRARAPAEPLVVD